LGPAARASGPPVPAIDSLLAATALHHDLRLVTRNTRDFDYTGLEVINPWQTVAR
jgi:predicted nucleic acid-binding protein